MENINFKLKWYRILKKFPATIRHNVMDAIMEFLDSGTIPVNLDIPEAIAFEFIKAEIEEDQATPKPESDNAAAAQAPHMGSDVVHSQDSMNIEGQLSRHPDENRDQSKVKPIAAHKTFSSSGRRRKAKSLKSKSPKPKHKLRLVLKLSSRYRPYPRGPTPQKRPCCARIFVIFKKLATFAIRFYPQRSRLGFCGREL